MAKGLRNYSEAEQEKVISARLQSNTGGLGYLAAKDAQEGALRRALIEKGLIKPQEKEAEAKA
jgi:hypothetical protein